MFPSRRNKLAAFGFWLAWLLILLILSQLGLVMYKINNNNNKKNNDEADRAGGNKNQTRKKS